MAASVYARVFGKAVELAGGAKALSERLGVSTRELNRWLQDKAEPPLPVFLKAVDLLISETPAPPGGDDASDASAPRDCAPASYSSERY
ncbi:MAG TPA: hypothetical protein VD965_14085 [Burkholderiales bacterium]|nr:hypothetical protein [Burkholderiales bacterium]